MGVVESADICAGFGLFMTFLLCTLKQIKFNFPRTLASLIWFHVFYRQDAACGSQGSMSVGLGVAIRVGKCGIHFAYRFNEANSWRTQRRPWITWDSRRTLSLTKSQDWKKNICKICRQKPQTVFFFCVYLTLRKTLSKVFSRALKLHVKWHKTSEIVASKQSTQFCHHWHLNKRDTDIQAMKIKNHQGVRLTNSERNWLPPFSLNFTLNEAHMHDKHFSVLPSSFKTSQLLRDTITCSNPLCSSNTKDQTGIKQFVSDGVCLSLTAV